MERSRAVLALAVLPVLGGCASTPGVHTALVATQRVDHVDLSAREPMLVEHPSGTLFVTGYGEDHPTLWSSRDAGATWSRVDVGPGAVGNSDVDLAVAPDGTLYFAAMTYDRAVYEGRAIAVGVSTDTGATWRWTPVSQRRFDDRPWVEVAPDGTAHLVWNDDAGVHHRVSRDRGATWANPGDVHDRGGSSHLAVGPRGELAVRVTPAYASYNRFDAAADLVAVSTDGGATWTKHAPPARLDWGPTYDAKGFTPRWVEPLAWDAAGHLYAFSAVRGGLRLVRSSDRGATWDRTYALATSTRAFFPYLVARGAGELAATWFTAGDDDFSDLLAWTARWDVRGRLPRVDRSEPFALESARPREKDGPPLKDPAGEYLGVALLRDGSVAVVSPIQNAPENRRGFTFRRFRAQGN